jgi:hypothetical protein
MFNAQVWVSIAVETLPPHGMRLVISLVDEPTPEDVEIAEADPKIL